MKQIEVVAAIIRKDDKIFATQRGYGKKQAQRGKGKGKRRNNTVEKTGKIFGDLYK